MSYNVKIVREDENGDIVESVNWAMPTKEESIEVFEEFETFGETSPLIKVYPHIGNRPDDRG